MLATLVIGLREGLEAALIVGIIAAFLRKNGHSLVAMWVGVVLAVILSLAVGVGLAWVEQALPQAAQEGLETVIGALAVVFVTGMIFWMNQHARDMKRQIEADAAEALSRASGLALAVMAFLAVLKEGFETSVFLLATFSAAQSAGLAAAGAIVGLLMAVVIGWGIYVGGVRINLSRFFRATGVFLILVAAGLVVSSLRTAHEAGWLNVGQGVALHLAWLVAPGTIQSALVTGVLGIPADPRQIEVIGWLAYLVPTALLVYWPQSRRPSAATAVKLRFLGAGALAGLAAALALFYPEPATVLPGAVPIVTAKAEAMTSAGTISLERAVDGTPSLLDLDREGVPQGSIDLAGAESQPTHHAGMAARLWTVSARARPEDMPEELSLDDVVRLAGGRLPRGLSPSSHPGPFTADWTLDRSLDLWTVKGQLLDAQETDKVLVKLSGSGLMGARFLRVADLDQMPFAAGWQVSDAYREKAARTFSALELAEAGRAFWVRDLPIGLLAIALFFTVTGWRLLQRERRSSRATNAIPLPHHDLKGEPHASH
ncbi:FTR1 family protein [Jiella sp. MQZ9-1]|uniref:FTR1 family protein n=1 Tax=Jiella flava TaxID=2816857 RepID=A0A939FYF0_9HYPH|nr:iron uptake transporter permease EfeU [Jiella flava]MBO0662485.1 FTR1 family protein [Jiella flava]MCD2471710.1 FTR1 family protein [Jiella flava]